MTDAIDPLTFRRTLGHYPTGVCAITSVDNTGAPVAMIVGSFTSVSLDPPLVAFFPDKGSTSWPKIQASGRFCVNVLADDQEELCRVLASKGPDKFDRAPHQLLDSRTPILDGALLWIDCSLYAVHEAGDHYIAIGRVGALEVGRAAPPLIFHKGRYGKVAEPL
jgi:flavin reductase (DIM6/NTAB) family NADH-FMN oxidoreductase RutF